MNELLGTMTCECGATFELRQGDSTRFFEERLSLHARVHRLGQRGGDGRQEHESGQDDEQHQD